MAQLMPLPPTASCFSKIWIGFIFLVLAHPGNLGQRAVKRVCVCCIGRNFRGAGARQCVTEKREEYMLAFIFVLSVRGGY